MFEFPHSEPKPVAIIRPSIFLEYGADGNATGESPCEVCERGMRFCSQWQFETGTMLHVAFTFFDGKEVRVEAEGIVVECSRESDRQHQTTLAFVETPKELRASLGKVSAHLSARLTARPISS